MKGKRGVSSVISTVLLVLIVIAAIGILAVVINNFVKGSTDDIGSSADCLDLRLEITLAKVVGENVQVKVKRSASEGEIDDLIFSVNGDNFDATSTPAGIIPALGEVTTYNIAGVEDPIGKSVEVEAVIGGKSCGGDIATIA